MTEVLILADHRERNAPIIELLNAKQGVCVRCESLKTGDYEVGGWMFERKTLPDFARSVIDGRLFCQAHRLASSSARGAMILEGKSRDLADVSLSREAFQGALISLMLIFEIPVLRSNGPAETASLLLYSGSQLQRLQLNEITRPGPRPKRRRRLQSFIVQGLPGVGPRKAELLLQQFGGVERIFSAPAAELKQVSGIGDKIALDIRRILEPDDCILGIESRQNVSSGVGE